MRRAAVVEREDDVRLADEFVPLEARLAGFVVRVPVLVERKMGIGSATFFGHHLAQKKKKQKQKQKQKKKKKKQQKKEKQNKKNKKKKNKKEEEEEEEDRALQEQRGIFRKGAH